MEEMFCNVSEKYRHALSDISGVRSLTPEDYKKINPKSEFYYVFQGVEVDSIYEKAPGQRAVVVAELT